MIKLVCKTCRSDEIKYLDGDLKDDWFECKVCGNQFAFRNAEWEEE